MKIGFSTGSINDGNYKQSIALLKRRNIRLVEISTLREAELIPFLNELKNINLSMFEYISFHAPSKLIKFNENQLVNYLQPIKERGWPIIVHPDIIKDFTIWQSLGENLCIENMDNRKPIGRYYKDLLYLFSKLPKASFCFDIAHAKQVDPTMFEARMMIRHFYDRMKQVHMSDVNTKSKHEALNYSSYLSYHSISQMLPLNIPIIIESPISEFTLNNELLNAGHIFENKNLV